MKINNIAIYCVVFVVGSILVYLRDRSWSTHSAALQSKLTQLEFDFDSAMLLLHLQYAATRDFEKLCLLNDTASEIAAPTCDVDDCQLPVLEKPSVDISSANALVSEFIVNHSEERISSVLDIAESKIATGNLVR